MARSTLPQGVPQVQITGRNARTVLAWLADGSVTITITGSPKAATTKTPSKAAAKQTPPKLSTIEPTTPSEAWTAAFNEPARHVRQWLDGLGVSARRDAGLGTPREHGPLPRELRVAYANYTTADSDAMPNLLVIDVIAPARTSTAWQKEFSTPPRVIREWYTELVRTYGHDQVSAAGVFDSGSGPLRLTVRVAYANFRLTHRRN